MKLPLLFLFLILSGASFAQTSTLVSLDSSGGLQYKPDAKGNTVPDFSGVGYMNSEVAIPTVAVVKTVYPVPGDNLNNIQNAINQVAAMPVGADGFRGAILFKKGVYNISDTIQINASGIVLRGEGTDTINGTRFVATTLSQYTLFNIAGSGGLTNYGTKRAILDAYVPYGTTKISVTKATSTYKVGDSILITRTPDSAWINLLTMAQWGWTPSSYVISFQRKVLAVNGNVLTIDAPMVDIIDSAYATGQVTKYKSAGIKQCGIENMSLISLYTSDTAENHGWDAIDIDNAMNCWVRKVDVYYFGYSAAMMNANASWITVDSCKMLDAKSQITGERRYSFNITGQRCLVKNCTTRNGRHDFVTGGRNPGPNVFYNGKATIQQNDIGPHQRWATGTLYDNIVSNGSQDVQNRESFGTGHGWAGGQIMFWNCKAGKMIIQDPQGDETNWAIGCTSTNITNVGDLVTEPYGVIESTNKPITAISSLFLTQLNNRFGTTNKKEQTILFDTLPTKTFGDTDFTPSCKASAGLPVTFTSLNKSVATIVNGKIYLVGVGTAIINASQSGDTTYKPAPVYGQLLTVIAPLPLGVTDLKATIKNKETVINWQALNTGSIKEFVVEKSIDAQHFSAMGTVVANNTTAYGFADNHPSYPGYYRIKVVNQNGAIAYTNTLVVTQNSVANITIYPNPANNYLGITGIKSRVNLRITNSIGQTVVDKTIDANSCNIDLTAIKPGVYRLTLTDETNRITVKTFIKE